MRTAVVLLLTLLPAPAQSNLNPIDRLLMQSRQQIAQGNFTGAEASLNTALAQAQSNHDLMREILACESFSSLKERQNDLDAAAQC